MSNWEKVANAVENNYGSYVDGEEGYFLCPKCNEPIYECDWVDYDFIDLLKNPEEYLKCPVCEEVIELN